MMKYLEVGSSWHWITGSTMTYNLLTFSLVVTRLLL